jgi:hypothetical protein
VQASGLAVTPNELEAAPFIVRVKLEDQALASRLPAGSVGSGNLYRACEAHPFHPQGSAAADRDPQLHQSVLIDIRLWHLADMDSDAEDVRFWRESGHR